jgi:nucleoside-diphosphate-sugar epimerase/ubiquinone/menaquinone biosynthesis C-methylase UbiE
LFWDQKKYMSNVRFCGILQTPMKPKKILLTGATGFIGSHLLAHLLSEGHSVIAIARDTASNCAKNRVYQALTPLLPSLPYREHQITVLPGDVVWPDLGLSDLSVLSGVDDIVHLASLLKFGEDARARVMRTNLEGTQHLLAIAQKYGCGRFHYVSTAYVCGKHDGLVPETLHLMKPDFHNAYEESKWLTENEVHTWQLNTRIPATILRPSIVIKEGPTNNRLGYYAFATVINASRERLLAQDLSLTLPGDPETLLNLVDITDVVSGIMSVIMAEPKAETQIKHLTNPHPISLHQAFASPLEWMGLEKHVHLQIPSDLTEKTAELPPALQKITSLLSDLYPYLNFKGHFETNSTYDRSPTTGIPKSTAIITDAFLRTALSDLVPEPSKFERRVTSVAIRIARSLIERILRPSGLMDVQALYVKESRSYRWKHHLTTAFHDRRLRKRAALWVSDHVFGSPNSKVLDLATGTGLTVIEIAKQVEPSIRIIGMDLNITMLNNARVTVGELVRGDASDFVRDVVDHTADMHQIQSNSLDAITMVFGIGGIANTKRCFEEQLRALKPGGIAVLIDMHAPALGKSSCQMPFGLSVSPYLVWRAWREVTLPLVLAKLWGWQDPTPAFYDMPMTTVVEENGQTAYFEIVHRSTTTLKWWLGLPVMPIGELVVKKVVGNGRGEESGGEVPV